MIMNATVLRVDPRGLLVRDAAGGQEVFVNFGNPRLFRVGDRIRITYNGAMTMSIPPQITAMSITRAPQPPPQIAQNLIRRAMILQVQGNTLWVRDLSNYQQVIVSYPYAQHFCVGQQVSIQFDTITLGSPRRVTATEVTPLC